MHIRTTTINDLDMIREVHLQTFPEGEKQIVSELAVNLLNEKTIPQTIAFVAEIEGLVVGHVAFSPLTIQNDENLQAYIMAPLAVMPDYQKRHIGAKLVKSGIAWLKQKGINILFVYGDPEYYSRFGFSTDVAAGYTPPYQLQYPFGWQAVILNGVDKAKAPGRISCVKSLRNPELW